MANMLQEGADRLQLASIPILRNGYRITGGLNMAPPMKIRLQPWTQPGQQSIQPMEL